MKNIQNTIGEKIKNFMWEHPTKTIFILGFAVGFIIGILL